MYFIVCQLYFSNINEREEKKRGGGGGSVHHFQIDPQGGYSIQGINGWLPDGMCRQTGS